MNNDNNKRTKRKWITDHTQAMGIATSTNITHPGEATLNNVCCVR